MLFKTYDYQDDLLNDFNDYRFNIINKGRQLGISTITAGYIVWMMLFHRDKAILVMATKFDTAGNLVRKVKNIMKNVDKIDLDSRMRIGKSGLGKPLPEIKIFDKNSGKELFLMRLKISGGKEKTTQPGKFNPIRYTLIVDVKPLFKTLAQS